MRLALGERRRLALPRPLRRGQFRLESVPLLAAVLRTLLQTRNLRVLLLDVSSQPTDLGLQVFDPFPHGQAEHSHPRYDSRGDGFCPVAFDGVPVSAASDPLNNYRLTSQNEEDGITLALFDEIGVTSRRFVEIGSGLSGGNSACAEAKPRPDGQEPNNEAV